MKIMNELTAQWTIVRNEHHAKTIFEPFLTKHKINELELVSEQFSDENGRIDLIYKTNDMHILLVELETSLNGKYDFAVQQTIRYKNMKKHFPEYKPHSIILYAEDITSKHFINKIKYDSARHDFEILTYKMSKLQEIYENEVLILEKNLGISGFKITSNMPYTLTAINRFMSAFSDEKPKSKKEICASLPTVKGTNKGKPASDTSFIQHRTMAIDLGLITKVNNEFKITNDGKMFNKARSNHSELQIQNENFQSHIKFTLEQKRIILSNILKDDFNSMNQVKSLILLFLRYVVHTGGNKIPKQRYYKFKQHEKDAINIIFRTNWDITTNMGNIITWARNYCNEMSLIEIIKIDGEAYDKVVFTSLGSRIYNFMELMQQLKREIIQIPQQLEINQNDFSSNS